MKQSIVILLFAIAAMTFLAAPAPAQTVSFDQFLQQFPAATLPFSIDADALQADLSNNEPSQVARLDWAYFEFLPELENNAQFCRMPVYPEPVARFETDKYHAVLYNLARGASKGSKFYTISVFDKEGTHLGTHYIGGITNKQMNAFSISTDLIATVNSFSMAVAKGETAAPAGTQTIQLAAPGNPNELGFAAGKSSDLRSSTTASSRTDMK